MRRTRWACGLAMGLLLSVAMARGAEAAKPAVPDFCFLQVSDIHISPQPHGSPRPADARSSETVAWICEEAKQSQQLASLSISTPPPAFVIATGDLTEYGVIGKTWGNFEAMFQPLTVPLYVIPGNHDNTWTSMMPIMRKRHGGDHYSFEKFGCHFVGIDSATIQEPVPSLEARTLRWLREDLAAVPKDRPVFLFQHHPLSTTEFASRFEALRVLEVVREHNVVLLLMGHGHGVRAERWNGVDSVMGGSTFGPNTGYSIVSVIDGTLRVVYRYKDAGKPMVTLIEKPVGRPERVEVEIAGPAADAVVSEPKLTVKARVHGAAVKKAAADVNGRATNRAALAGREGLFEGEVPLEGLAVGAHYLRVEVETDAGPHDRAVAFVYQPSGAGGRASRVSLPAGVQAAPVITPEGLLVATTAGEVRRVRFGDSTGSNVLLTAGAEIIRAPAFSDGTIYLSAGEMGVIAAGLDGAVKWKRPLKAAVYGTPAVVGDLVYVGDLEGWVHAIERETGRVRWSQSHAAFSIEMGLVAHEGTLYFGAWDGFVCAVDAAKGELRWKQPGPAGQTAEATLRSRYYAPADCPPVVLGERVFVTDRSYRLGSYTREGKYLGQIADGVAAIGPAEDGQHFYARGLGKGVTKYDATGKAVWSQALEMGRFPCAPAAVGGRVYACSNLGLLSALDATSGQVLWQYQVSPQLHVMAPVAADREGRVYVAGMDGVVVEVAGGSGK